MPRHNATRTFRTLDRLHLIPSIVRAGDPGVPGTGRTSQARLSRHGVAENFDVFDFELGADDLARIDALDRGAPVEEPDALQLLDIDEPPGVRACTPLGWWIAGGSRRRWKRLGRCGFGQPHSPSRQEGRGIGHGHHLDQVARRTRPHEHALPELTADQRPFITFGRRNRVGRRPVTGTAQRPVLDDLVRDRVHRDDPTAHAIIAVLFMVRFDRVDGGYERRPEHVGQGRVGGARLDAEVDLIADGECIAAAIPLPPRQPHARHDGHASLTPTLAGRAISRRSGVENLSGQR